MPNSVQISVALCTLTPFKYVIGQVKFNFKNMNNENNEFETEIRSIFSSFLPLKINQIKIKGKALILPI